MYCGNFGCLWKGILEYVRDYEKGCFKVVVKCFNVGCYYFFLCEDMDVYSNSCEKVLIDCLGCRKDVVRSCLV